MLPTPSTSHVNYDRIYEPSEDSYLLLDTLSLPDETSFLTRRFGLEQTPPLILEVGTGSGVVLAFILANAEKLLGRADAVGLGVDVNPFACEATSTTARLAAKETAKVGVTPAVFLDGVVSDLTSAIRPGTVDMLVFNPPYVPSDSLPVYHVREGDAVVDTFNRDSNLLALSTDGGADGMETTEDLLSELPSILSPRGVAYILLCAQNKPSEVMHRIRNWPGAWLCDIVGSSGKQAGWEKLCIIRIWRAGVEA